MVLDWMLPDLDGLEVLRRMQGAEIAIPVLMLTARADEIDRVLGLEVGADDYLTKPFSMRELVARLHALLRRNADVSIHLWLSLRWPSFLISITAGFAASVANIFLVASHLFTRSALSPWAMPVHAYGNWGMPLLVSLIGAVLVYLLARRQFIRSDDL